MQLVEQHIIKKNDERYKILDEVCFKSKNLYNAALYEIRQHFFNTKQFLNWFSIDKMFKEKKQYDYYSLPCKVSQQTLKLLNQNFKSFFSLLKKKNYTKKKSIPKYLDKVKGRFVAIYTNQAISKKELKNGMTLVVSASYDDIRQTRYNIAFKILFAAILLAVFFSLIVILVVRRITHPLKTLTDASVKLSNGDYDVEITHSNTYEIKLLSTAFENMTEHLKEHEKLQHHLAYRDSLTGLRNTNSYWAWITDFDKEIETKDMVFGVMVFDINYLKETNDRYGHDVGNKLIVRAAHLISNIFKRSPVFRIGGDEFLVILQNRDLDELPQLLEMFDAECSNELVVAEKEEIPVSIAKGFARYDSEKDQNFIDVFNKADDAMYENKREIKGLK